MNNIKIAKINKSKVINC